MTRAMWSEEAARDLKAFHGISMDNDSFQLVPKFDYKDTMYGSLELKSPNMIKIEEDMMRFLRDQIDKTYIYVHDSVMTIPIHALHYPEIKISADPTST